MEISINDHKTWWLDTSSHVPSCKHFCLQFRCRQSWIILRIIFDSSNQNWLKEEQEIKLPLLLKFKESPLQNKCLVQRHNVQILQQGHPGPLNKRNIITVIQDDNPSNKFISCLNKTLLNVTKHSSIPLHKGTYLEII